MSGNVGEIIGCGDITDSLRLSHVRMISRKKRWGKSNNWTAQKDRKWRKTHQITNQLLFHIMFSHTSHTCNFDNETLYSQLHTTNAFISSSFPKYHRTRLEGKTIPFFPSTITCTEKVIQQKQRQIRQLLPSTTSTFPYLAAGSSFIILNTLFPFPFGKEEGGMGAPN